jgi:Lanthionine synthetase C-like protein
MALHGRGALSMRTPHPLLIGLLLVIGFSGPLRAGEGDDPELLKVVAEAAAFVSRQAIVDGDGARFPEYAEDAERMSRGLYAGDAGVLVFLENAAHVLGDPKLAALADRTFKALSSEARGPGLYTGDAGIGYALLVRFRLRGDRTALMKAKRLAEGIVKATQAGGGKARFPGGGLDIISGAAGTLLFLVEIGRETGDGKLLKAARNLGQWLAANGIEDGDTRWWPARVGSDRHYPHFSHGTSGVAYALARTAAATGDETCLAAALAGARWLLENGTAERGTLNWCHYLPGREQSFREGWCHGPAGTVRLFLFLHSLTGEKRYLEAANRTAAWVMAKKPLPPDPGRPTRFYSPSLCCGAAGVIDAFVDLYHATGNSRYRDYARRTGEVLVGLSRQDGDGRKWTNYNRPDENGVIYHGVSLMLGAAGEGLALLRLATIDREEDPVAHLPDRVVIEGPRPPVAVPEPEPVPTEATGLETVVRTPPRGHHGTAYVVLTNRHDPEDPFFRAALALARWRRGELITDFDPVRPEKIIPELRDLGARYVAIVLPAEDIDGNTQRRFLMAAARLDSDIFQDVAYGFITGTDRTTPLDMVERAKALEKKGLKAEWVKAAVASKIKSVAYETPGDPTAGRAGFKGRSIYFGAREVDPESRAFAGVELAKFTGGGVVSFSGCGDPEGIWLFDDHRNAEPDKHWPFDPEKVGDDPKGEMPRVTADMFKDADLTGSVVFTGVCHIGLLHRVFVEGDIVSTFGVVTGHTEYVIPKGRSVAGAILDAGAAAYIAPVGPNHGYRTLVEAQEGLEKRLSLGDITRSTYDDIALTLGQAPELGLHTATERDVDRGAVMASGGANRLLYGDPALTPFKRVNVESALLVGRKDLGRGKGFDITATSRHRDWWSWNMFTLRGLSDRIRVVVPLKTTDPETLTITAKATDADGNPVQAGRLDAAVECRDGARFLHLQFSAPSGSGLREVGAKATFRIHP